MELITLTVCKVNKYRQKLHAKFGKNRQRLQTQSFEDILTETKTRICTSPISIYDFVYPLTKKSMLLNNFHSVCNVV